MSLLDMLETMADMLETMAEQVSGLELREQTFTWKPGKPSIDICIPVCGDELKAPADGMQPVAWGLYYTVESCERELRNSGLEYRYYIVDNGNPETGEFRDALERTLEFVEKTGHVGKIIRTPTALNPPGARNMAAAAGTGDLIFFFDNHCLVEPGYFTHAIHTFEKFGADSVHGVTRSKEQLGQIEGERNDYHLMLHLEEDFWGTPSSLPKFSLRDMCDLSYMEKIGGNPCGKPIETWHVPPYRIAMAGHGAFAVRRDVWQEVDGYWNGFVGFGGEESYFDLKLAMMDKTNWLNPAMSHWHTFSKRAYKNDIETLPLDIINRLAVANIIGGQEWALKVANSREWPLRDEPLSRQDKFRLARLKCVGVDLSLQGYQKMLETALERSADRARWFAGKRLRTLDEQLEKFRAEDVATGGFPAI